MRAHREVLDRVAVARATHRAADMVDHYIELGKHLEQDSDRVARLKKCECKWCYYQRGRIGGAAMTSRQCGICDKDVHSGNTNVDALCKDCASKHKLCAHCGADLELRPSRRNFKFLNEAAPTRREEA